MVGCQALLYLLTEEDFCDGCNNGLLVSSPLETGDIFNRNRHLQRLPGAGGRSCSVSPPQQSQGGSFGVFPVFVGVAQAISLSKPTRCSRKASK
jgi:hypothetical protein